MTCRYCDVIPRNPCVSDDEVMDCPNAEEIMRAAAARAVDGPNYTGQDAVAKLQNELDNYRAKLAEYRRRFGSL